ncbi:hypothetical protein CL654_01765 [bacterium]|nr:hypothetical protein [bacterium]|tara:strand:- start:5550 stop:6368 length:819 start_codon:yes stop_codon:yes gene_type:complete
MNNLNNHQLVLLTLLVSFVTSIATGIFTVTLIDQAPPSVTNTINRVVERTVETVIPTTQETIVRERVVVDKGGDLIVAAVEKASPALVRTYSVSEIVEGEIIPKERSTGFFINDQGLFVSFMGAPEEDLFVISDGGEYFLEHLGTSEGLGLSLFALEKDEDGNTPKLTLPSLALAKSDVQVGQTAIVLNSGTVAVSFVSGLVKDEERDPYYRLYLDESDNLVGAPVINVEENVIGILQAGGELVTAETIARFITATTAPEEANADSSSQIDA